MTEEEQGLYQLVANYSQEMIIGYDDSGSIFYVNNAVEQLTGYLREEILGGHIENLLRDVFEKLEDRIFLKKELQDKECKDTVIYRKNLTCFPVEIKIISHSCQGKTLHFCMALNMTRYQESIRRMEDKDQEAKESMKARDAFVANVTHELRTPLNGIKGHAEILMEQETQQDKQNYIRTIQDCCETMEKIINNILDFSKLNAGKFELEEESFSFHEFIEGVKSRFSTLTGRKGLIFSCHVEEDIPDEVIGDKLRLTQILNNLVSNAVKFTERGYVGIEVVKNMQVQDEMELFFIVADTGIGLSPEDKDKLFQSFSQADTSTTRKYGGTGLGLSITKDLVNMMRGDIWAEGEKGKGSSFSFTIRLKLQNYYDAEQEHVALELPKWRSQRLLDTIMEERQQLYQLGSEKNGIELRKSFEKMNLSMDMDNWYMAEISAGQIRCLVENGTEELKRAALKTEMAVRKADYQKARQAADLLKEKVKEEWKALK